MFSQGQAGHSTDLSWDLTCNYSYSNSFCTCTCISYGYTITVSYRVTVVTHGPKISGCNRKAAVYVCVFGAWTTTAHGSGCNKEVAACLRQWPLYTGSTILILQNFLNLTYWEWLPRPVSPCFLCSLLSVDPSLSQSPPQGLQPQPVWCSSEYYAHGPYLQW